MATIRVKLRMGSITYFVLRRRVCAGNQDSGRLDFMTLRAVFLDAGYTLLYPHPSVEYVCALVCRREGHEIEAEALKRAMPPMERFIAEQKGENAHIWSAEHTVRGFWEEYYRRMLWAAGFDGVAPRLAKLMYDEFGSADYWKPFAEVEDVLKALHAMGLKVGVISDWGMQLVGILHELEFSRYLDFVAVSASIGVAKPNSLLYEMALARAHVDSHEAVHVGDDYRGDVLGARSVGITPIFLDRQNRLERVDCERVTDLWGVVRYAERAIGLPSRRP
ncbi:MAG: HAD-IA family hydrolase [Chloroflexi bacterium]|nr:HAD-IA family hydrolase [Chloroflexota bacterium]